MRLLLQQVRRDRGSALRTVTTPAPPVTITTSSPLSQAQVGVAFSQTLQASMGTGPYTWSQVSGSLPNGLTLTAATGAIAGTPTVAGDYTFTIRVTDATSATNDKTFTMQVNASSSSSSYTGVTLGTLLWGNTSHVTDNTAPSWKTPEAGGIQKQISWGVDVFQISTSSLAGYMNGTLGNWDTYPLVSNNNQTNFIGFNGTWSYGKPAFLGIYLPDILNAAGKSTLFNSDSAWTTMCARMKNLCAWASTHGFIGLGFDWEITSARGPKWKQWANTQLTEAAARALAPDRGEELMTKMVEGWDASSAGNGLRLLSYNCDFPRSWKKWQECYDNFGGNWDNFPNKLILTEFWQGMTSVSGWTTNNGGIWFISHAFYKTPQGGQQPTVAGWDYSLNYDKAYHRNLFNTTFSNPEKIGWGPFGWVGAEAERPVETVAHVQQQFQRFDAVGPDGIVADYRNGGWSAFDPTAYSAVYAYYP